MQVNIEFLWSCMLQYLLGYVQCSDTKSFQQVEL
jgi:hypothetical protein